MYNPGDKGKDSAVAIAVAVFFRPVPLRLLVALAVRVRVTLVLVALGSLGGGGSEKVIFFFGVISTWQQVSGNSDFFVRPMTVSLLHFGHSYSPFSILCIMLGASLANLRPADRAVVTPAL